MKFTLTFLILLFAKHSICWSQDDVNKSVTLLFENPVKESSFLYLDEFGDFNNIGFDDSIRIESSQSKFYFELSTANNYQVVILKASDKIKFKLKDGFFVPTNVGKEKEMELRFFEYFRKSVEKEIPRDEGFIFQRALIDEKYILNPELRTKIFYDRYKRNVAFLKEYVLKNELSNEFLNIWQTYFKNKMMEGYSFFGNKTSRFPKDYILRIASMKDFVLATNDIFMRQFQFLVNNYFSILRYQNFNDKNGSFTQNIELINSSFTNETREWLLFRQIVTGLSSEFQTGYDKNEILSYLVAFLSETKNTNYRKFIQGLINKVGEIPDNSILEILPLNGAKLDLKEIAKKSTLTYVDIWASWCAPCIQEMQFSKLLKAQFNPSEIQFVYVSTDENSYKWEKASQRLSLENTFLESNQSVTKTFKIKSIPRYVLLNNKGEIVDFNALRPSDVKIKSYLEANLKKENLKK